jgi:hypothetical protein
VATPTSSHAGTAATSAPADTAASIGERAARYFQIGISTSIEELDGNKNVPAREVMEHASYTVFLAGAIEFLDRQVAADGGCTRPTYISFNTNWKVSYKAYYVCSEAEALTVYNKVASANQDAQQAAAELTGSRWSLPDGWWTVDGALCPTTITSLNELPEAPSGQYEVHWGGTSYCLTMLYGTRAEPDTTKPAPGTEKAYLAEKYRKMLRDLVHEAAVEPSEWDTVRGLLT